MNNIEQVVTVLEQAVNIALKAGAYSSTKDVSVINTALDVLKQYVSDNQPEVVSEAPITKSKK